MYISSKNGVAYLHKEWNVILDDIEDVTQHSKELLCIIAKYDKLLDVKIKIKKLSNETSMLEVDREHFLYVKDRNFDELYSKTGWVVYGTFKGLRLSFTCTDNGKFTVGVPIVGLTESKEKDIENLIDAIECRLSIKDDSM